MKKILFVLLILPALLLVACDGNNTGNEPNPDVSNEEENVAENEVNNEEANVAENESDDKVSFEEEIADDEYLHAIINDVEFVEDDIFGDSYTVHIDLENKTEQKIVVQARDVSADGLMVDDMVIFSQEIAGEKRAKGKLEIISFEEELPALEEELEFKLIVFDDETFEQLAEYDVKLDF